MSKPFLSTADFIHKAIKVHGDRYDYKRVRYKKSKSTVIIGCSRHGYFKQRAVEHWRGKGCVKCGRERASSGIRKTKDEFIKNAIKIHGVRYDYLQVEYHNNKKKVKINCNVHGLFMQTPGSHLCGRGCPKCKAAVISDSVKHSKADFIRLSEKVHGKRYRYDRTVYIDSKQDVFIGCLNHGYFYQKAVYHTQGCGCPKCCASKGEICVEDWLIANHVKYEKEKSFFDCRDTRPLFFDFYIFGINACVEYDGSQHFRPEKFSRDNSKVKMLADFEDIKKKDALKKAYCKKNGIKLIRIPYTEFNNIEKILEKELLPLISKQFYRVV